MNIYIRIERCDVLLLLKRYFCIQLLIFQSVDFPAFTCFYTCFSHFFSNDWLYMRRAQMFWVSFELIQFKLGKPFLNRKIRSEKKPNKNRICSEKKIGNMCDVCYIRKPFNVAIKSDVGPFFGKRLKHLLVESKDMTSFQPWSSIFTRGMCHAVCVKIRYTNTRRSPFKRRMA